MYHHVIVQVERNRDNTDYSACVVCVVCNSCLREATLIADYLRKRAADDCRAAEYFVVAMPPTQDD